MSRISKYQSEIIDFLQKRSFVNETSETTRRILNELLETMEHIPAILCLTILNNQRKKNNLKIHGYYLATGIDIMMIIAKICSSRDYFNKLYGVIEIDNVIMESTCAFYKCISQNIETVRLSKNGSVNPKLPQLCIEYATRYLPLITKREVFKSQEKMKKTDLFCFKINSESYTEYKKKHRLNKTIILDDANDRYGSVCKLALCLGWMLGQSDDNYISKLKDLRDLQDIQNLEKISEQIGLFLKIYDDFKYFERDMDIGDYSLNYIINYGVKEAYSELIEAKTNFIEGTITLAIETKTNREIIDHVIRKINDIVKDVSVDMETQYDDVSCI